MAINAHAGTSTLVKQSHCRMKHSLYRHNFWSVEEACDYWFLIGFKLVPDIVDLKGTTVLKQYLRTMFANDHGYNCMMYLIHLIETWPYIMLVY